MENNVALEAMAEAIIRVFKKDLAGNEALIFKLLKDIEFEFEFLLKAQLKQHENNN